MRALLDERNVSRVWQRLRRKAQHEGVRPLRLHDCRHTFASLALASGKSIRWVASQLGHSNPELTLRVYAHALREEETDLSFLDFGGTKRHPRGTERRAAAQTKTPLRATPRRGSRILERETGLEPATLSLGSSWSDRRNPAVLRRNPRSSAPSTNAMPCHTMTRLRRESELEPATLRWRRTSNKRQRTTKKRA